jgi:hypothetical protein
MRWLGLVILVAACSNEHAARLTLHAPDGPSSAASFDLVLATPSLVPVIPDQRVDPHALTTESVNYFLQRSAATGDAIPSLSGYTIVLEPSPTIADTSFIPFLLAYDASGALVAIGTYHADPASPQPSAIVVQAGEVDEYTLDVEPVHEADASMAIAPGQALRVACTHTDGSSFESGIAWHPSAGPDLRILLPDDPASEDATQRQLDLDCDAHAVAPNDASADCDDVRAAFHEGAPDTCDGEDTNCDNNRFVVVDCPASTGICPNPQTGSGVALCDDTSGIQAPCQSDAACLCATNASCTKCQIAHIPATMTGSITPCQPGIGQLTSPQGCAVASPCTVAVIAVRGGWEAEVAADTTTGFARQAMGVGSSYYVKARRPEGPGATIPGVGGGDTGEVDLAITDQTGATQLVSVDLRLDELPSMCPGSGPYPMVCSP